jgi:hypothetical protein
MVNHGMTPFQRKHKNNIDKSEFSIQIAKAKSMNSLEEFIKSSFLPAKNRTERGAVVNAEHA